MDAKSFPRIAVTLLLAGALLLPTAAAFPLGVGSQGVNEMKQAGASIAYGQVWVGRWMKSDGWGFFEDQMRIMTNAGVTPVILWYYWGDKISPNTVQYGKDGYSKGEWDAMAKDMATRAKNLMGGKSFLVVLEPEFNKGGISQWETFDGYLADQARMIKSIAPNAKIVVGFGSWGGWDNFDRAMGAADYAGFQAMRGSTRDSAGETERIVDNILSVSKTLKNRFGKSTFLFDFAIATYGGWEGVQEKAIRNLKWREGELYGAGLAAIVWRYVRDNDLSSGYYGPAESSWGVRYSGGGNKPAFDDLVSLSKGSSTSEPAPAPEPAPSGASAFSEVSGNEWWIQAKVSGSPTKVEGRVNGGSWFALSLKSWGAWAVSKHAPMGSKVELRATYGGGSTASATYAWPPGASGGSAGFDASFSGIKVEEWWVQASVKGTDLQSVSARVNGGSWTPLTKQSWGGWAKSIHVTWGSCVEFQAKNAAGATDVSQKYCR